MHSANVTICSPFRDSGANLPDYFDRLSSLDYPGESLCFVFVEGDSLDDTWIGLSLWAQVDKRTKLVKCNVGTPHYGSIVHPVRFRTLATVFNAALDAVDYEWSDYVLFLPSDIHYRPDLLSRLLAADKDIVAPFSWSDGRFYDSWGFVRDGQAFDWFKPCVVPLLFGDEPIEMDSVGGVVLIKADVLKAGCRYTVTEVDRGLCKMAKAKGFGVWADPSTHVYHAPFVGVL